MVLPVDRCGSEDKVKEGAVERLFDLVPLPSLQYKGGFICLRAYYCRSVSRECPRGIGEANERLPKHGCCKRDNRYNPHHTLIVLRANQNLILSIPVGGLCINYRGSKQKPCPAAEEKNSVYPKTLAKKK